MGRWFRGKGGCGRRLTSTFILDLLCLLSVTLLTSSETVTLLFLCRVWNDVKQEDTWKVAWVTGFLGASDFRPWGVGMVGDIRSRCHLFMLTSYMMNICLKCNFFLYLALNLPCVDKNNCGDRKSVDIIVRGTWSDSVRYTCCFLNSASLIRKAEGHGIL